jgi:hypothetical protein
MADQQFPTPHPVQLEVKVAAGEFRIQTVDGETSRVSLAGAPALVDAMRVEQAGDRLVIEQRRKSWLDFFGRWGEPVQVHVRVPHGSSVNIVTAAGEARLEGSFAELEMKSASGGVFLTGELAGSAHVKSVSGDVRLPGVGGDLNVQTVSGNAVAESVGGSVSLKSVSGDLRVGSLREGTVDVQSVSGDVELGIARGTAIDVDAHSASGDLDSEVQLSDAPGDGDGPTIVIRGNTVSGDIRIFRANAPSATPVT